MRVAFCCPLVSTGGQLQEPKGEAPVTVESIEKVAWGGVGLCFNQDTTEIFVMKSFWVTY